MDPISKRVVLLVPVILGLAFVIGMLFAPGIKQTTPYSMPMQERLNGHEAPAATTVGANHG